MNSEAPEMKKPTHQDQTRSTDYEKWLSNLLYPRQPKDKRPHYFPRADTMNGQNFRLIVERLDEEQTARQTAEAEVERLKEVLKRQCVHCQDFPHCRKDRGEAFYGVLNCGCTACDCKGEENARSK